MARNKSKWFQINQIDLYSSDVTVGGENSGIVVGLGFLCLGCVLDKNKIHFLVFFKDFACLLRKLTFKNISLVDFQS